MGTAREAGTTREALLHLLLHHKEGLTTDELAARLGVTRNAVRQHLTALERDGMVVAGGIRRTGGGAGRPGKLYRLSRAGLEQFPRQYSLLSGMVLATLRDVHGPDVLAGVLREMAERLAGQLAPRVQGETMAERVAATVDVMNEFGYVASVSPAAHDAAANGTEPGIEAVNCVYHHLAAEYPDICKLDVMLLERLTGVDVELTECMVRGGNCCRFRLQEKGPKHFSD